MKKAIASGLIGLIALGSGASVALPAAFAQDTDAEATEATQTTRSERRAQKKQALADALGMTVEELQAARDAGESLSDIADAQGVDLEAFRAERRAERQAEREARRAAKVELLTSVLGVSADDLQAARDADQTLADIAVEQGVSVDAVVDALVANAEARITAKAQERGLDAAAVQERLDGLEDKITARVNGEQTQRGHRAGNN